MDSSLEKENSPPDEIRTPEDSLANEEFFTPASHCGRSSNSSINLTSEESLKEAEDIDRTIKELGVKIHNDMEKMKNLPSWKSPQKQPSNLPNFSETRHSVSTTDGFGHVEREARRSLPTASQSDPAVNGTASPEKARTSSSAPNVAKILGAKLQAEVQYAEQAAELNNQLQGEIDSPYLALNNDLNSLFLADCSLPEYQLDPQIRRFEKQDSKDLGPSHSTPPDSAVPQSSSVRRLSENPRLSGKFADSQLRVTAVAKYKNALRDWEMMESKQHAMVMAFLRNFPDKMKPYDYVAQIRLSVERKIKKAEAMYYDKSLSTADLDAQLKAKQLKMKTKMKMSASTMAVLCDFQKTYSIPQPKKPSEARKLHTIDESALEHLPSDNVSSSEPSPSHAVDLNLTGLAEHMGRVSLDTTQVLTEDEEEDAMKDEEVQEKAPVEAEYKKTIKEEAIEEPSPAKPQHFDEQSMLPGIPPLDFTSFDMDTTASFLNTSARSVAAVEVDFAALDESMLSSSRLSQSFRNSPKVAKERSPKIKETEAEELPVADDDLLDISARSTSRRNSLERYNEPFASPKESKSPSPPIVSSQTDPNSPPMGGQEDEPAPEAAQGEKRYKLEWDLALDDTEDDIMNFTLPDSIKKSENKKRLEQLLESGEWRRLILGECCAFIWSEKEAAGGCDAAGGSPDTLPEGFNYCNELRSESLDEPLTQEIVGEERIVMLQEVQEIAADLWPLQAVSRTSLHIPEAGQYASSKYCRDKHPSELAQADFQAICTRALLENSGPSFVETASRWYNWNEDIGRKTAHEIIYEQHPTYLRKEVKEIEEKWKNTSPEEEDYLAADLSDIFMKSGLESALQTARLSLDSARQSLGRPSTGGSPADE